RQTSYNDCNGVDAIWNTEGIHLVWSTRELLPNFKTFYSRLTPELDWEDYKEVTDHPNAYAGGNPSVAVTSNQVFVSFNTNTSIVPPYAGYIYFRERLNEI